MDAVISPAEQTVDDLISNIRNIQLYQKLYQKATWNYTNGILYHSVDI